MLIGRRLKRSRSHKNNPYKRIKPKTEAVSFETPPLETNLRNVRSVFFQLIKPFKGLFALDIMTYLGATVLNGFLPFMVSRLLDALQQDFEVGDFTFSDHSFEVLVIFMSIAVVSTVLYRLNSLVLANFEPAFRALSRAGITCGKRHFRTYAIRHFPVSCVRQRQQRSGGRATQMQVLAKTVGLKI